MYDDRLESEGTAEDRLLLAGLRSLSIRDRIPGEGRGLPSSGQGGFSIGHRSLSLAAEEM